MTHSVERTVWNRTERDIIYFIGESQSLLIVRCHVISADLPERGGSHHTVHWPQTLPRDFQDQTILSDVRVGPVLEWVGLTLGQ